MNLLTVSITNSVLCDAVVTQNGSLLFGSFWGRDTAIQEFLARLQLPSQEGGTNYFEVDRIPVTVGRIDDLDKQSGRVNSALFGKLIHLWVYTKTLFQPDYVNHRGFLLQLNDQSTLDHNRLWTLVQAISPLPLLDAWLPTVLDAATEQGWMTTHQGHEANCVEIALNESTFKDFISSSIRSGLLSVNAEEVKNAA